MDTRASALTGAAARLYLALVLNAPIREYTYDTLTEVTGLERHTLYQARDHLVHQGFVRFTTSGRIWVFDLVEADGPVATPTLSPVQPPLPTPTLPVQTGKQGVILPPKQSVVQETARITRLCQAADASGNLDDKLEAMQQIWELIFPAHLWPANRLAVRAARDLLRMLDDRVEWVFETLSVILDGRKVQYPLGYSKSLLIAAAKGKHEQQTEDDDSESLDGLRAAMRARLEKGSRADGVYQSGQNGSRTAY